MIYRWIKLHNEELYNNIIFYFSPCMVTQPTLIHILRNMATMNVFVLLRHVPVNKYFTYMKLRSGISHIICHSFSS